VSRRRGVALHNMRIGLRRLKTVLSLFKTFVTPADLRRLRGELGWLLAALGPARDIEVFLGDLDKLPTGKRPEVMHALALLRGDLRNIQHRHFCEAEKAVQSSRYAQFVQRLSGLQPSRKRDRAGRSLLPFARRWLKKHHARILDRLVELDRLDAKQQHELRIAVKKLRYSLEFFSSLFERRVQGKFIRLLRKLQDSLGHLNDMKIHRGIMDDILRRSPPDHRVPESFAIGFIEGVQEIRGRHYVKAAARIGRKLSGLRTPW
jgi:CHAD domain-containing protein